MSNQNRGLVRFLQEFSIPLIAGVIAALLAANLAPEAHHAFVHFQPFDWLLGLFGIGEGAGGHGAGHGDGHGHGLAIFGHPLTVHFLIDDFFMVLFFGIAAKEITEAALPGGSLNPIKNAINPLIATIGGVAGPIAAFFVLLHAFHGAGAFPEGVELSTLSRGWGIPTATDIALAWLVARTVFGRGHAAIDFLLLLAVADDAIGLVIIAVFYGDPNNPAAPEWLGLVLLGMAVAYVMRRKGVSKWQPYILVCGPLAWSGLVLAHLHAALALVFIVPFLPGPKRDTGMFMSDDEVDVAQASGLHSHADHSPLHMFEHSLKTFVDFGLFFFAFANAGVAFSEMGALTWTILGGLVLGKTVGISFFGVLAAKIGFPLPTGMTVKDLMMAGFIAALGLTVALFVASAAYTDPSLQGQAKMGALFSGGIGIAAIVLGKMLGFGKGGGSGKQEAGKAEELPEKVTVG